MTTVQFVETSLSSGGSRPSDKGEGGHPDPEIKGGGAVLKAFFSALGALVWSKNKGGGGPGPPGHSPGSATAESLSTTVLYSGLSRGRPYSTLHTKYKINSDSALRFYQFW